MFNVLKDGLHSQISYYRGPQPRSSERITYIIGSDCYVFNFPHLGIINAYGKNFSELMET